MKKFLTAFIFCFALFGAACAPSGSNLRTLTYLNGEETFYTEEVEVGETLDLSQRKFPAGLPQKPSDGTYSYVFLGWSYTADGSPLSSVQIAGNTTFYAVYRAEEIRPQDVEYTVLFLVEGEDGETVIKTQKVKSGGLASPPSELPVFTGYHFAGWDKDPSSTQILGRTEFRARYEKNVYRLYRHVLGGTYAEDVFYETPLALTEPALEPAFCFEGWFSDGEFKENASLSEMPASDVHIYAKCSLDVSAARLSFPEGAVYGGENAVSVRGLPRAEGLSYAFDWGEGRTGETLALASAGEHALTVAISARYAPEDGRSYSETFELSGVFTVLKRPIFARIEISNVEYGEAPSPALTFEDLLPGDTPEANAQFIYRRGEEQVDLPLPAGRYSVSASAELANYDPGEIAPAEFEVTKRQLLITAVCEDLTYGEAPAPGLSYEGFVPGEDESALAVTGPRCLFLRAGEPVSGEKFPAGEYELRVNAGGFSSLNYAIQAGPAAEFRVAKAPLTISVALEESELVYGMTPRASVTHTPFAFADETEESVFHTSLCAVFSSEEFSAGEHNVRANFSGETENYAVTSEPLAFTIAKKPLRISLPAVKRTFGEELGLPAPDIEGLIEGEEGLKEELEGALSYSLAQEGRRSEPSPFPAAGEYAVELALDGEYPNYEINLISGALTVEKRAFLVSSGEVSQNRDREWSYVPTFSGPEAELFEAEGLLALETRNAGTYTAARESELKEFRWRIPLKIKWKGGEEVTENFDVRYALHVTLNNSRFRVTVPTSGLEFVYDGTEHAFAVQVSSEEEGVEPAVKYTVNGYPAERPVVKDAGTYVFACEIGAENYETESRSYTVEVRRAAYALQGESSDLEGTYNGAPHGEELTVSGVGGEDVREYLRISVRYVPFVGEPSDYLGWQPIVNAGKYEFSYRVEGNPNYEDLSGSFTATISRAEYEVEAKDQSYTYVPGRSFGVGVTVRTLPGEKYSVEYEADGRRSAAIPTLSEAGSKEIGYTVSEGVNYEEKTGGYRLTVSKAEGKLNIEGIRKRYVYSGMEQKIESGATSNNHEDEVIVYENNTFRTVKEGNALVVTVKLKEGKNYTGDEATVMGFTVEKQRFSALPVEQPAPGEQINRPEKTLSEVPLKEDFRWKDPTLPLKAGEGEYPAVYNPDSENCEDFALTVKFSTRKERLSAEFFGGEGSPVEKKADYKLTGEDGTEREIGREYFTLETAGEIDETRGGTYPVTCTLMIRENDYFELMGENSAVVPYKLGTVEVEGRLYTLEDALKVLNGGIATVKSDTAMMSAETRSRLSADPYPGEEYSTVKPGATLLVPCSGTDTGSTAQQKKQAQSAVTGEGYVTLTLPEGAELKVEGRLTVNALRSSDGQRTSMVVGGNFGNLELEEGSLVTVRAGGVFDCMGFCYGAGKVMAESGSEVFEPFAMPGWKGGAISAAIRNNVFPLNQYALTGLIAETNFQTGSKYSLRASVSATLSITGEQNLDLAVAFLGDGAFLDLKEGELVKSVRESDGKALFTARGELTFRNLEMNLSASIRFNSSGLQVPIPGNLEIRLERGSAQVPSGVSLKLLPGARVEVLSGAALTVEEGGAVCGYGTGNADLEGLSIWQDGGNGLSYPCKALGEAYRRPVSDFGYTASSPAKLFLSGELEVKRGGTLAAEVEGEKGVLTAEEGALLTAAVKEDKTPAINGTLAKLQALGGSGGVYFTATLRAVSMGEDLTVGTKRFS